MKRLSPLLFLFVIVVSSCGYQDPLVVASQEPTNIAAPHQTAEATRSQDQRSTPVPSLPTIPGEIATNTNPVIPALDQPYSPQLGDAKLEFGEVFLEETGLITLETFPVQVNVRVTGNLPTPCHQLRVLVSQPDGENRVFLEIYSITDPSMICTQVLEPFDATISLGSFPGGHYSVVINGVLAGEFDT